MHTDNARPLILKGAVAITPFRREEGVTLVLKEGKIDQMGRPEDVSIPSNAQELDLHGKYILPGFIDIHVHGGKGYDFCDNDTQGYEEISQFHASHGTTSIIATIYPQPKESLIESVVCLRDYCEAQGPERIIDGIHLEGPFLNPEMHGAIRPDYMWEATENSYEELCKIGGRWIKVMTIAPEIPGAIEVMRAASLRAVSNGSHHPIHLSIGHSNANYEQIAEAIDNGLEGVTHIFNAMPSMHHRKPGVLGGTLLRDELFVEVIADAVHVHPAILQLLLKVKKYDRIILVSDAIRAAGQPDGVFDFSGQKVLMKNGRAYLEHAPETLAGSTLTMDQALRTMVEFGGAKLEEAAQMASLNAARILEWKYKRGILAVGKDADLAILDENLSNRMTIKSGRIVWSATE
ncbi:MAG: N-acetylglucosamine-6-phosphate deacetylase [Candidatus Hinthialibacter antarcticus]|nr:N-acetylglucosamine-6-phosphate deacetylase [Candidatus Hinthialibacter antarcticus]